MWKKLLSWSQAEFAHLPWRKDRSMYGTLVSEIMLQQTTVGTVLSHYHRFLNTFPDLKSLAGASEEQVCKSWQGLGYYRRARNLRKAAMALQERHKGKFPSDAESLKDIPGIGDYTANALLGIGADQKALAIDANVERVLSRLYARPENKGPVLMKALTRDFQAGKLLKEPGISSWRALNEALMDLGRVFCQARRTYCNTCPMAGSCQAHAQSKALEFPVGGLEKKIARVHEVHLLRVLVRHPRSPQKIMGTVKADGEWLSGQVEVPTFILKSDDEALKQYPRTDKTLKLGKLPTFKTTITKYRLVNHVLECDEARFRKLLEAQGSSYRYFSLDSEEAHFSTATRKLLAFAEKAHD